MHISYRIFNKTIDLKKSFLYYRYLSSTIQKCETYQKFEGEKDIFNGITVDTSNIDCKNKLFSKSLSESLKQWSIEGKRCIWFKIHIQDSACVPLLAEKGFNFHHASSEFLMMYKWLPTNSKPNLPPASHTNLGVGALVLNKKNQLLAISEKSYNYPHWKLPGGYVEKGEDIIDAGVREVKEETGVDCCFVSLITFRHSHNMMYGNSDIYIIMLMEPLSEDITLSERELRSCQWMNIEEYTNHPDVHKFNKLIVKRALEYREKNIKLDIQKKVVKFSVHTREMNIFTLTKYD